MKKITQLLLLAGFIFAGQCFVYGQYGKIARQHNDTLTTYTDLIAAITASVNGDTLYLPGGPVYASNPTITIDKSLAIIGAGHYPDSTVATYQTTIAGTIKIVTGADGGVLCGVKCNTLWFGSSVANQNVNNYRIMRCNITGELYPSFTGQSSSQYILISECIINTSSVWTSNYFTTVLFEKNIIHVDPSFYYGGPGLFNNCIFYSDYSTFFTNLAFNTFNNCIIIQSGPYSSLSIGSNSTIFNNLLVSYTLTNLTVTYNGPNTNTITKEPTTSTFENANTTSFFYTNNYHVKTASNGHNTGTDGTDVGIYGTLIPYKESAVPFNPHISSKTIGTVTTPTGTLNVDIKVSAQDR